MTVTVQTVESWSTSDGQLFDDKNLALLTQAQINLRELIEAKLDAPYGEADREAVFDLICNESEDIMNILVTIKGATACLNSTP